MAEESGKGIALVILGIVAIIAIVGLVLLFTGAKKAATGEFAVPGVREYGGALRGVYDPYARTFTGRSYEYEGTGSQGFMGQENLDKVYSSSGIIGTDGYANYRGGTIGAENIYGQDGNQLRATVSSAQSYSNSDQQVPSEITACTGTGLASLDPSYATWTQPMSANQVSSRGWSANADGYIVNAAGQVSGITVERMKAIYFRTPWYGLDRSIVAFDSTGTFACTVPPGLGGLDSGAQVGYQYD